MVEEKSFGEKNYIHLEHQQWAVHIAINILNNKKYQGPNMNKLYFNSNKTNK